VAKMLLYSGSGRYGLEHGNDGLHRVGVMG
jgi:hypothetical protein